MSKANGFEQLVGLFEQTYSGLQREAARAVNRALTVRNWLFGWYIVEFEQFGVDRAEYGKGLLADLSLALGKRLGRGFSVDNLELMRKFYFSRQPSCLFRGNSETLSRISASISETSSGKLVERTGVLNGIEKIWQTLSAEFPLSWSHYVFLMAVSNPDERAFYEKEAANADWSWRELKRQFNSGLYERLALSRDKEGIKKVVRAGAGGSDTSRFD